MKTWMTWLIAVAIGQLNLTAAEPMVEVGGLRVVTATAGDDDELRPFNWNASTTVALRVTLTGSGITGFDKDASRLTVFKDDAGKDLLKAEKPSRFGQDTGFGSFPKISKDGHTIVVEAESSATPSRGAKAITLNGELVLTAASQKAEHTAKNVALTANTQFKAGPFTFIISKAGKPGWSMGDEDKFGVTLKATQDLSSIADLKFLDASGKPLEARRVSTSRMGFAGRVTEEWDYNFTAKADAATIVVSQWTDQHEVKVPISLTFGVGM